MKFRSGARLASFFLLALLMLIVFVIVALMYIDPSQFKGQIEKLAQSKGVELELSGDLSWELYPNIQLIVNGASASHVGNVAAFDADIEFFTFALKPWAAMRGELDFVGAEISGANVQLRKTEGGSQPADLEQRVGEVSLMLPQTMFEYIEFSDVRIQTTSAAGELAEIYIDNLIAEKARSDGEPFSVVIDTTLTVAEGNPQHFHAEGYFRIDLPNEIYAIDLDQFRVGSNDKGPKIQLDGYSRANFDIGANHWSWEGSLSDTSTVGVSGNFSGAVTPIGGQGRIEANITDVNALLAQFSDGAAKLPVDLLAVDSDLIVSESSIALNNLRLRVDGSPGRGSAEYIWGEQGQIAAKIGFQELNLDQYLSPSTSEQSIPSLDGAGDEGPLSWIKKIENMNLELSADQLVAFGAEIEDLRVVMQGNPESVRLQIEPTIFAGGRASASAMGYLNGTVDLQDVVFEATSLRVSELVNSAEDSLGVDGFLSLDFMGGLKNIDRPEPLQGLQGVGQVELTDLVVTSVNIERNLCESAELLGATTIVNTAWTPDTRLGSVNASYTVTDGLVRFQDLDFNYGNMEVKGGGTLSLVDLNYDLGLLAKVNGAKTSENGCNVNKYAQGVPLPMQCAGTLGAEEQVSCGLDSEAVQRLVVQQVGGQLIEGMLGRLIGDESEADDSQPDLGNEVQSDSDDARKAELRNILEGLLKNIDEE